MPGPRRVRAGVVPHDRAERDGRDILTREQRMGVLDEFRGGEFDLVGLVDDLEGRDRVAACCGSDKHIQSRKF